MRWLRRAASASAACQIFGHGPAAAQGPPGTCAPTLSQDTRCFCPRLMAVESWRLSRQELRRVLDNYEKAVEDDALNLLRPSEKERKLLGDAVMRRRAEAVRRARDANRHFVEMMVADLPDLLAGPDAVLVPPRPIAEVRCVDASIPTLPASSYGSMASVLLHFFRDWSTHCDHVGTSTYAPAIAELRALRPDGGDVLVPGAGLGRLALMLAAGGFRVEANDASRLFLTAADYLLNRAPVTGMPLFPLAHVFSENWSLAQQYIEVSVPSPSPAAVAGVADSAGSPAGDPSDRSLSPSIVLVPGDFVKLYGKGGPGHRCFDAIVTSFFIDTVTDIAELVEVMDGLLQEGGVWINVGPLNWRKEARMKLCNDEIIAMWESIGYEFVALKNVDCDYHMPRGLKMYTESYQCSLTAAVKRRKADESAKF